MSEDKIKVINKISYQPQSEYILVRTEDSRISKSAGNMIIIPVTDQITKKTMVSVIVAVGPGRRNPNKPDERYPIDCEPGQKILTATMIGFPLLIPDGNGKLVEHQIIKYNDILAFVEEDAEWVDAEEVKSAVSDQMDTSSRIISPN